MERPDIVRVLMNAHELIAEAKIFGICCSGLSNKALLQ